MKLDYVQFGVVFGLCRDNPLFGYRLGYICNGHMTPEQFIRSNSIVLIDEEPAMVQVEFA